MKNLSNKNLSQKEQKYATVMNAGLVPFMKGKPGVAKSAIARSIANKLNMKYIDLRLATADETDLGLYPTVVDGVMNYAIPKWAIDAATADENGYNGALIHFEELNRCNAAVRNAALGVLLERVVANSNILNKKSVWMISSGNLGDEDGTEVEEMDTALLNRLIHFKHELTVPEWVNEFAKENVNEYIVEFIEKRPEYFYKRTDDSDAYATPRSWTFVSDFINANFEEPNNAETWLNTVATVITSFVGESGNVFVKHVQSRIENEKRFGWEDILNGKVKNSDYKKMKQDLKSEILGQFKEKDVKEFNTKQMKNFTNFLNSIAPDEAIVLFVDIITKNTIDQTAFDKWINNNPAGKIFKTEMQDLKKAALSNID